MARQEEPRLEIETEVVHWEELKELTEARLSDNWNILALDFGPWSSDSKPCGIAVVFARQSGYEELVARVAAAVEKEVQESQSQDTGLQPDNVTDMFDD